MKAPVFLLAVGLVPLAACGNFVGFDPFPRPDLGGIRRVELRLGEDALDRLGDSYLEDRAVPGRYQEGGREQAASIQLRGGAGRRLSKKSFTVTLQDGGGEVQYALDAGGDTWVKNRLAMYAYRLAGLPAAEADGVALFLNGEYLGYYNRLEIYNREDLQARYGGEGGELFKVAFWHPGADIPLSNLSEKKFPDDDDFSTLDTLISNAVRLAPEAWKEYAGRSLDAEELVKYLTVHNYFRVRDTVYRNFYVYSYGKLLLLPWDNELAMESVSGITGSDNLITHRLLEDRSAGSIRSRYEERMRRLFLEPGPENLVDRLRAEAERIFQEIDRAVAHDPYPQAYELYVSEKAQIRDFLARRSADLAAIPWPP